MSKKPKFILLVEDEPITALATVRLLKQNGYDAASVNSGEAALGYMKANSTPALILMDIDLGPGIDGPETARKILKEHDIPIVFNSSHTEKEMVEKTEKITSYGYIVKNTGVTVLLAILKLAFKLHNAYRELKKREEELRRSEERMRLALRCVPVTIFQQDRELRYTWMHGSQTDRLPNSVKGKIDAELFSPELAVKLTALKSDALEGVSKREQITLYDSGATLYYDMIVNPLYDAAGTICGITGASWDITAVKRMEELQKVRLYLDSLARTLSTDEILTAAGQEAARITGSVSGFLRYLNDYRNTEDLGSAWVECVKQGGPILLNGHENAGQEGNELAVPVFQEDSIGAVFVVHGKPTDYSARDVAVLSQLSVFSWDIISRMQAAEKIKESEKRLKEAERIAGVGHYEIDAVTGESIWSEGCFALFGYNVNGGSLMEPPTLETYRSMIHPEDTEKVYALYESSVRENRPFDLTYRIIRKDGEIRHVHSQSRTIIARGGAVKLFGTLKDVTEKKHLEEEVTGLVKQKELLLKELQHRIKNRIAQRS